jgi:thiamine biosynthesis lipoprotein
MSLDKPTRRRAITIFAAAAAGAFSGGPACSTPADFEWHGVAMGADATILFNGIGPDVARAAIAEVEAEIDRLEGALSLYRPDSELCRLNRAGRLFGPSGDMRRALSIALGISAITGGLFDPTVQPLWETYVDWFTASPEAGQPPDSIISPARASVDWHRVSLDGEAIRSGPGQRLTLNGLGQGYVTDRVADLLAARDLTHVLVDLGEQRALAPREGGAPWVVKRVGAPPLRLATGALATSEGAGCVLGAAGAVHHLFDPRTGRSAAHWKRLTVHHRSAAVADALSTALYIASADEIKLILPQLAGTVVWARDQDDREWCWLSPPIDGVTLQGAGRSPHSRYPLEHDPEKCEAVFRKDHAQSKS